MSPAIIFTKQGVDIMALKTETTDEQTNFDELEWEVEETTYTTISGKAQSYEPEWDKFNVHELEPGVTMEGTPEITIFEKEDKSYNTLRLSVFDDGEILDCYLNFPKKDYPYVKGLNKDFEFYRPLFKFIFNILKWRDEKNVIDSNGEEITRFKQVNLETFAKYVDRMTRVGVKITKEDPDSDYNDWEIYKME